MRQLPGYRLEHFWGQNRNQPMLASQYIALTELIKMEKDEEAKQMKDAERKGKRRR